MNVPAAQPIPATLRSRCALVDVRGAAYLRREHVRVIESLVTGGTLYEAGLQWVWNFAVNPAGKERCLRLLAQEIIAPETTTRLTLPGVINQLLPVTRTNYPVGEVCKIFLLSYDHLRALKANGQLPAADFTPRAALEKFLKERLVR